MLGRFSIFFALLLLPVIAYAMPDVVVSVGSAVIAWAPGYFKLIGVALVVIGTIWGGDEAKRAAKEKEDAAKRAYNNSLKDRAATVISSEQPHRYIYGRARVGSAIVAALSSGSRDEYKHLICIHAAHECDAIEEIYINGKALGTLDVDGYVTSGDYYSEVATEVQETFWGTGYTLAHTPIAGTLRLIYLDAFQYEETDYTLTDNVISGAPYRYYYANYSYNTATSGVRVLKHLGSTTQTADATLISEIPTLWDSTKKLSGLCYTIITLNLNFTDFQGGCPSVEALIRGKKLHDVRDGAYPNDTPIWSQNNALMIADYLTSEMCGVPWTDLPLADFIAAANVCDETKLTGCTYAQTGTSVVVTKVAHGRLANSWIDINIESGLGLSGSFKLTSVTADTMTYTASTSQTTSGNAHIAGLYTANGTVDANQSQTQVIEKMAQSMAGTVCATTWGCKAGKYVAPVMSLSQSDIVGDMSYTAGTAEADLYNGVKGQYISAENLYVATDFVPYQNSTYVTADGGELWTDVSFMFTETKQRVHNICRIFTEDQRNGFTISATFSYKTWDLQIGDRVAFTSDFMGQTAKVYRIIKKSYAPDSAVNITMKEDASSIWDLQDAVTEDSTPNTNLPSAFYVPTPGAITVSEELYETTGSSGVKVKAIVTWDAPADVNVLEYEIVYKGYFDATYSLKIFSLTEYIELLDMSDGQYDIKIRARNNLNVYSAFAPVKTFTLYGLTTVPGNVLNFTIKPFNGSAICSWDKTIDLDVKIGGDVEIRYCPLTTGQSWEQSYIIPDGAHNGDATTAIVSLATGTYYAKFIDSTGSYSVTEASFIVTEALITGWTTVTTTTQDPAFTGSKTDVFVDNNALKLGGTTLWDDMPLMDTWGQMDYMGGVATIGTYLFSSTVDLTTSASRRFHLTMQALSISVSDTIDSRLANIDTWESIDGDVINGTDATVYASVSDDDITYSDWAPFMVADFKCRYAKFKAVLSSNDPNQNIELTQLRVAIKIPV